MVLRMRVEVDETWLGKKNTFERTQVRRINTVKKENIGKWQQLRGQTITEKKNTIE
jgi:hypothetical protein